MELEEMRMQAGKWIAKEFAKAGADEVICQLFKLDINTFPGKMEMSIDGKKQVPGVDFTVREFNPSIRGEFKLYYIDMENYDAEKIFADLATPEYEGAFVVCDFMFSYKHSADFKKMQSKEACSNSGLIYTWESPLKFYKAYGETVREKPIIWVTPDFPKDAKTVKVNMENEFLKDYECFNVIAKVEGIRHNSDHYPFAQRNVPCIFLMNEEGDAFKYYHTIHDTWKNSIFTNYEPTFNLIKDFIEIWLAI